MKKIIFTAIISSIIFISTPINVFANTGFTLQFENILDTSQKASITIESTNIQNGNLYFDKGPGHSGKMNIKTPYNLQSPSLYHFTGTTTYGLTRIFFFIELNNDKSTKVHFILSSGDYEYKNGLSCRGNDKNDMKACKQYLIEDTSKGYTLTIPSPSITHTFLTSSEDNNIQFCLTTPADPLKKCKNVSTSRVELSGPKGIVLSPDQKYVYIANLFQNQIIYCTVNALTGEFSNCRPTGNSNIAVPNNLVFNKADTIAYIVDRDTNIAKCAIGQDGALNDCVILNDIANVIPFDIALGPKDQYAYITEHENNTVDSCLINAKTGNLSNCKKYSQSFSQPTGLAINTSGTMLYISNNNLTLEGSKNGYISRCSISSGGVLNNCSIIKTKLSYPNTILLFPAMILITNSIPFYHHGANPIITSCSLDSSTGDINNCINLNVGNVNKQPWGIAKLITSSANKLDFPKDKE